MPETGTPPSGGLAAFAHPDFILYEFARFFIVATLEMQSVAVGWQVYEITKRPLDLGFVGLAQFLPGILFFLVAGHVADRYDRRKVLEFCYIGFALCSAALLFMTWKGVHSVGPIYVVMVTLGIVRCFNAPTSRALLPQLVPGPDFPNAVAWNATIFQGATILGPSLGGLIYAATRGPEAVYAGATITGVAALVSMLRIKLRSAARPRQETTVATVFAGFRYIWRQKLILGSISLDLFAVLLGGAVALLPVYAKEILQTGPWGLGLLRSAPGVGAAAMAVLLAHRPLRGRIGLSMLWCVAGFGVFTILFGVSRSLVISLGALMLVGAFDMVSVIVRAILVQVATPDHMRGRVNAVDMLFIGASNEFGQFESGLTAQWFGTVPSVVLGGIGTLVVIGIWAWLFPELRKARELRPLEDPEFSPSVGP